MQVFDFVNSPWFQLLMFKNKITTGPVFFENIKIKKPSVLIISKNSKILFPSKNCGFLVGSIRIFGLKENDGYIQESGSLVFWEYQL